MAYGVHKITFDSGMKETIPKAILTTRYSHAIGFYKQSCINNAYEQLSDSMLWGILKAIKPSQRKSLAGLDDISAAGMNAFDLLDNVTKGAYVNDPELQVAVFPNEMEGTISKNHHLITLTHVLS